MRKLFFLGLLGVATAAQAQDSVTGMCTDWGYSVETCACAVELLHTQIGDPAYKDYEAIGQIYRRNGQDGMAMVEAWDAAIAQTGADLSTTNTIGQYFSDAIAACE